MAKKSKGTPSSGTLESAVVGFAEDLGKILGTTQAKAENWLNQRKQITQQLTQIRETANRYLRQLTGGEGTGTGRAGRPSKGQPRGEPAALAEGEISSSGRKGRRKGYRMSAAQKKAVSARMKGTGRNAEKPREDKVTLRMLRRSGWDS